MLRKYDNEGKHSTASLSHKQGIPEFNFSGVSNHFCQAMHFYNQKIVTKSEELNNVLQMLKYIENSSVKTPT